MPVSISISIEDRATPELQALMARMEPAVVAEISGEEGVNRLQDHLRARDVTRANKMGGARTHFYAAAAASAHYRPTGDGVDLVISQLGLALRLMGSAGLPGGAVQPSGRTSTMTGKPIRHLALPARSEAYGKRPSDFGRDALVPLYRRRGGTVRAIALALKTGEHVATRGRHKGQPVADSDGVPLYWLVARSVHAADPSVLPSPNDLGVAIVARLQRHLARREAAA